mmetsp:Transcript_43056/g.99048  ORF Transcript_43056/g.99048 Transcript_43056/m.99048 type:complete len:408 (+) Transcript_43056:67-1290(+)
MRVQQRTLAASLPSPAEPTKSSRELYEQVCDDIMALLGTEIARDSSIPGRLEDSKGAVTMTRLWDSVLWSEHRSEGRWLRYLRGWPRSTILRAIRLPFGGLLAFALCVLLFNRLVWCIDESMYPLLRLPQTPLGLQAASIGLILVFRTNQTHDRLREAQKEMARLSAVEREVLQMLIVHIPVEYTHVICLVARLLAYFGWLLKAELWETNTNRVKLLGSRFIPAAELDWICSQDVPTSAVIFRIRSIVGALYNHGCLDKEAFKFVEDDLQKLGDIRSVCERLATFPIPPSYHRHGSRAIMLWIGALPFALDGKGHGLLENMFTVAITGFVVLGLDAIAIQTEQPFDVMPLQQFATGMSRDVQSVLRGWCSMPGSAASSDAPSACANECDVTSEEAGLRHRGKPVGES